MFKKYNAVMRGAGVGKEGWAVEEFHSFCQGNKYSTTIWAISLVTRSGPADPGCRPTTGGPRPQTVDPL